MEPLDVETFCKLIDVNSNVNSLYNEGMEHKNLFKQCNKRPKLDCTKFDENVVTRNLVIDQLLEECTRKKLEIVMVVKKFLFQQFRNVISLYKNGSVNKVEMNQAVTFVEALLSREIISLQQLSHLLLDSQETDCLPLNFIWHLSQLQIISFQQVINRVKDTENAARLLDDALSLILKKIEDDSSELILKDFIAVLIVISYELKSEFEALQQISNQLLSDLLQKFLEVIMCMSSDSLEKQNTSDNDREDFVNIFDLLLLEKSINAKSLQQFLSNQLILILTFKPEVRLSYAIQHQSRWRSPNSNKILSSILLSIVKGIGHEEAFSTMDKVVSSLEVNWICILTFLGTLLLAYDKSAAKLKEVVDSYIRRGCSTDEKEFLILGFLFARHASMEGRHIFPSYLHWFGATFGSANSSPANNKQSFVFLFQFLTELVPYESASVLRAHIHQSIFMPKGCQSIFRDYQQLAKVRLQEINDDFTTPSTSGTCINPQPGSHQNRTLTEIKFAVEQFEESRKIPSFILEAAIFRKPYFLSSFLPLLLTPRHLPEVPDAKLKLIEKLFSLEKIPEKMYKSYQSECQKMVTESVSVKDEESADVSTSPFSSLQKFLKEFVDFTVRLEDEDTTVDCMKTLSKLTQIIEDLTAVSDVKFKGVSSLTISCSEFNSETVAYKIVTEVLDAIDTFVELSPAYKVGREVNQLFALLATSTSLQNAFITTLLHSIQMFQTVKGITMEKVKFVGISLCELNSLDGRFLPMRLSTSAEDELSSAENLLLKNLPLKSVKDIYFSCSILNSAVEWNHFHQYPSENPQNDSKMRRMNHLYFCLASRLAIMNLEEIDNVEYLSSFPSILDRLKFMEGSQIPQCCQMLRREFSEFVKPTFEDWVNFELKAPWGRTPLNARINHLRFWFHRHFVQCQREIASQENSEKGFLFLFWELTNAGVQKENSAEMLILLQSLSFNNPWSISLLEEWKEWKKTFTDQIENETCVNAFYHSKLVVFLSLCHSLPPSLFIGKSSSVVSLSLVAKIIHDILEMEGNLFLSLRETSFFLECFLDASQRLNPPELHVQHCFAPLRDSVVYHLQCVEDILKGYLPVVEKYRCFDSLLKIEVKDPRSFKSLPARDTAVLLSSLWSREKQRDFGCYASDQSRPTVLLYLVAVLGCDLIKNGEGDKNKSGDCEISSRTNSYIWRMVESVSSFVDEMDVILNDPSKLMSDWKEETRLVPIFWKAFLLGFAHLLSNKMKRDYIAKLKSENVAWFFSFLLLCFNNLAKMFEKPSDTAIPSLTYLSKLNYKICSIIHGIPAKYLRLIPDSVLRNCDKEIVTSIGFKCARSQS